MLKKRFGKKAQIGYIEKGKNKSKCVIFTNDMEKSKIILSKKVLKEIRNVDKYRVNFFSSNKWK